MLGCFKMLCIYLSANIVETEINVKLLFNTFSSSAGPAQYQRGVYVYGADGSRPTHQSGDGTRPAAARRGETQTPQVGQGWPVRSRSRKGQTRDQYVNTPGRSRLASKVTVKTGSD